MEIVGLGYLGLGAADPREWLPYGRDVIGLAPARVPCVPAHMPSPRDGIGEDGSVYFKLDEWAWRIAIHPSAGNRGLLYMGFEVRGPGELAQALEELRAAGYEAVEGTAEQARARAVAGIGYTRDPAGNPIELFYGPLVDGPFVSPRGMRFVTGDMGLGHVNLFVEDFDACERFYVDVLGFRLTDYYQLGEREVVRFYHVNPRHHTIALMRLTPINAVHHILFEVPTVDDVGAVLDRATDAGCKITATLGRHSNDRMLSFYMESPSGFQVEIGCGAVRVGDDWTPRYYPPGDVWGHRGLTAEAIESSGKHISARKGAVV